MQVGDKAILVDHCHRASADDGSQWDIPCTIVRWDPPAAMCGGYMSVIVELAKEDCARLDQLAGWQGGAESYLDLGGPTSGIPHSQLRDMGIQPGKYLLECSQADVVPATKPRPAPAVKVGRWVEILSCAKYPQLVGMVGQVHSHNLFTYKSLGCPDLSVRVPINAITKALPFRTALVASHLLNIAHSDSCPILLVFLDPSDLKVVRKPRQVQWDHVERFGITCKCCGGISAKLAQELIK